jgi:ubiquinone/menaquinone biosynthesis C-methylase UbiE
MYGRSARYYDAIYSWKSYEKESAKLHRLIRKHKRSKGKDLLDVACGTGGHLTYLKNNYAVEGLDINEKMLRIARKKHPDIVFHRGDMTSFKLSKQFDAITCLFSAIGHMKNKKKLDLAIRNMSRHLKPGGVLLVESWFTPQQWHDGSLHANFVNQPRLKVARMNISKKRGRLSILDEHHLVATPERVEHFVERLEMGLFTRDQYLDSFRRAKLKATHDPKGIMGRGLYIGTWTIEN